MTNAPCLKLNASFEPMVLVSMKDALRLVLLDKADIVEADPTRSITSERAVHARPLVIRLKKFITVPRRFRRKVSNTFLFARDNYTCQYCGRHERALRAREFLNRDHVQPMSRGGDTSWANCVTACSSCNSKKDNKTPKEAGLRLRSIPGEPQLVHLRWQVRKLTAMQQKYVTMFYGADAVKGLAR